MESLHKIEKYASAFYLINDYHLLILVDLTMAQVLRVKKKKS